MNKTMTTPESLNGLYEIRKELRNSAARLEALILNSATTSHAANYAMGQQASVLRLHNDISNIIDTYEAERKAQE